jgi:hypothetical protein
MAIINHERVSKALDLLKDGLQPHRVVSESQSQWERQFSEGETLCENPPENPDGKHNHP